MSAGYEELFQEAWSEHFRQKLVPITVMERIDGPAQYEDSGSMVDAVRAFQLGCGAGMAVPSPELGVEIGGL